MALRTNSKKAMDNLFTYINDYCAEYLVDGYGISGEEVAGKSGLYKAIYQTFKEEMRPDCPYYSRYPEFKCFRDWAQGLAMGGLFCYYYNREAVVDLGQILEESEEEKAKYTEDKAEELLTWLIYREITKEAKRA